MKSLYYLKNVYVVLLILVITPSLVYAWHIESGSEIHQYITNESKEINYFMPYEIKNHIGNTIYVYSVPKDYNEGDKIIHGSAEEDASLRYRNHYWEPDNPKNGKYDDGILFFTSSYDKAKEYWLDYVIPYYVKGEKDKSYYWLGRVVHLIEDSSVPAHMQKDIHTFCGDSNDDALECYINLAKAQQIKGSTYENQTYNYENLISSYTESNWESINPRIREATYPEELFKLFWYTAQKTQYYASDDSDGNDQYKYSDGTSRDFSSDDGVDLWSGDGVTMMDKKGGVSL